MNKKITNNSSKTDLMPQDTNLALNSYREKTIDIALQKTHTNRPILIGLILFFLASIITPSFQIVRFLLDDTYSIADIINGLFYENKVEISIFITMIMVAAPVLNLIILMKLDHLSGQLIKLLASIFFKYKFIPVVIIVFLLLLIEFGFFGNIKTLKGVYMYTISISIISYLNWRLIPDILTGDEQARALDNIETYKKKTKETIKKIVKVLSTLAILFLVAKITTPIVMTYLNKSEIPFKFPSFGTHMQDSSSTTAPPINISSLVSSSDDYSSYSAVFEQAAGKLISDGRCSTHDFSDIGGWLKSTTTYKDRPIYFIHCGGSATANRIYLDASNGMIFK